MSDVVSPELAPRVILVEDDLSLLAALKFSLETEGFTVETHPDAASALAQPLPGAGCLVIDYFLPGMDGLELLRRLREREVRLPAVLITSHPTASVRGRAAEAGVVIIEKPLLEDHLLDEVRTMLAPARIGLS